MIAWNTAPSKANLLWRLVALVALLVVMLPGLALPTSAQSIGAMVIGVLTCDSENTSCRPEIGAQFTVTTEDGTYVGSCTVEGDPNDTSSIPACVVYFLFEIAEPLVVTENLDTISTGYAPEENPIVWVMPDPVTRPSHDVVFRNFPVDGSVAVNETSDIAIVPTENGQAITDACFILTTYGNNGCDDNGDGKITFREVPLGTYTVHQTADLGPGRSIADFTIVVTGAMDAEGWERFGATVVSSTGSTSSTGSGTTAQEAANGGPWLLGIQAKTRGDGITNYTFGAQFTVTSTSGEYIGECTLEPTDQKVPWWNCKVEVPSDTVSLVWEDLDSIPEGFTPVENPIRFDPTTYTTGPHNIGAVFMNVPVIGNTSSSSTSTSGTRDIALITRDPDDGHLILDGCYILLEYGNEGCDENGDGQITFIDVPVGVYTVHQTQTPSGYPTIADFKINVDGPYPDVPLGYVVRQTTQQVSPGSQNVSVVFVDSRSHTKIESSICVQLVGGSEPACDDALVDGQIDFLDVETGTYPMTFTGLPAGWQILTGNTVTIDSAPGTPSIQFIYVEVSTPNSVSAATGSGSGGTTTGSTSGGTSPRTWTGAVTVVNCDAPPTSGVERHCGGGAGIVVNFSLASGEFLGSCTTGEPFLTPWGPTTLSTCTLEGLPFNADIVTTQDRTTLPAGYVPINETSVVHVDDIYPGGGDGTPFNFSNYLAVGSTTASSGSSSSNPNASATLLMTFRGCPEGFDPATDDYFANCTIPLDAPDASFILWGGDGQGGMNIMWLERQYDGAYIYRAWPMTMTVELFGLAPVVRDAYTVIGADGVSGDIYSVYLTNGETRQLYVFYYFL